MVSFKDTIYLILFFIGLDYIQDTNFGSTTLAFIVGVGAWYLFWCWFEATFVSRSKLAEVISKVSKEMKNDNKTGS